MMLLLPVCSCSWVYQTLNGFSGGVTGSEILTRLLRLKMSIKAYSVSRLVKSCRSLRQEEKENYVASRQSQTSKPVFMSNNAISNNQGSILVDSQDTIEQTLTSLA